MNRLLTILTAITSTLLLALPTQAEAARDPASTYALTSPHAPQPSQITIKGDELRNAGELPIGGIASHSRVVSNGSKHPLQLRVVHSSCPCVTVHLGERPVSPGEEQKVALEAPVLAIALEQSHWVVIEAAQQNDDGTIAARQQFRLQVRYTADISLIVKPDTLWIAGASGSIAERTVYIRTDSLDALQVRNLFIDHPDFSVASTRTFAIVTDTRNEQVLAVTIKAILGKPGVFSTALSFATDDPDFPEYSIPIHVRIRNKWTAAPAGFAFIFPEESGSFARTIKIADKPDEKCPVARVELRDEQDKPITVNGLTLSVARNAANTGCTITATADTSKLLATEGVASVALFNEKDELVQHVPLAWVKPVTIQAAATK